MAKKQMISPVLCLRCGETYDLANVEVVARYADCTMFKTPCCGKTVDDRTWVGSPAIRKLDDVNPSVLSPYGLTNEGVRFRRAEEHKSEF